jgi:transposase InsO family protein
VLGFTLSGAPKFHHSRTNLGTEIAAASAATPPGTGRQPGKRHREIPPSKTLQLGRIGVRTLYIELGSPWENGYCESFNGKLRDEFSTAKSSTS